MLINMSDILEPVKTLSGTRPVELLRRRGDGRGRLLKDMDFLGVDF